MAKRPSGSVRLDPEMALFLGGDRGRPLSRPAAMQKPLAYTTEALRLRPGFQGAQRLRCASLAQAGRVDEARAVSCNGAARAARAIDRLDQGERSLPDARADGALSGGMRKAGLE